MKLIDCLLNDFSRLSLLLKLLDLLLHLFKPGHLVSDISLFYLLSIFVSLDLTFAAPPRCHLLHQVGRYASVDYG